MSSNDETVECPKCGECVRLTPEQADYDELIVIKRVEIPEARIRRA